MAPVDKHPRNCQVITPSTLGKRGSNAVAGLAQSGSKRLRKMGGDGPQGSALDEIKQAWVASQTGPVAPEALRNENEEDDESASE
ncbi:hypothetical protein EYR40_004720 [Pleurotus pulmonarius]|nr:hypothetical protein EYR36_004126 [Pleurotus pulmonarius]KAF4605928.1 hypothetical protein EYR40_004720 [Pleurotus pulmonarius]